MCIREMDYERWFRIMGEEEDSAKIKKETEIIVGASWFSIDGVMRAVVFIHHYLYLKWYEG